MTPCRPHSGSRTWKKPLGVAIAAVVAAALLGFASAARAEPRFAARTGFPCSACHVNPTGGGLRTAYGRDVFEKQQLTLTAGAGMQRALDFDPRLGDLVTLGSDFRMAFIWQPTRSPDDPPPADVGLFLKTPTKFAFFPMQADIYLGAEVSRHAAFYLDYGVHGSFEVMAILRELPGGVYAKAGLFTPPYGTKLPNHTAAHRQPIGFDPRAAKDAGAELGVVRKWLDAAVAVQNGESSGSPIDKSEGFALTGRVALLHDFAGWLKLTAGASGRRVSTGVETKAPSGDRLTATNIEYVAGPFLWLSLGRFTYIGEADFHILEQGTKPDGLGRPTRKGQFVTYGKLDFLPARGVDVGVTHEFMDRDIFARSDPADAVQRFGLQASVFPAPYVHGELFVRTYGARADREENGQWEAIAFVHLFF